MSRRKSAVERQKRMNTRTAHEYVAHVRQTDLRPEEKLLLMVTAANGGSMAEQELVDAGVKAFDHYQRSLLQGVSPEAALDLLWADLTTFPADWTGASR